MSSECMKSSIDIWETDFGGSWVVGGGRERISERWFFISQYRWLHRVGDLGCLGNGEVRREVVNACSALIESWYRSLAPSFSLGCASWLVGADLWVRAVRSFLRQFAAERCSGSWRRIIFVASSTALLSGVMWL